VLGTGLKPGYIWGVCAVLQAFTATAHTVAVVYTFREQECPRHTVKIHNQNLKRLRNCFAAAWPERTQSGMPMPR
jgi:hypothetical protein